MPKGCGLFAFIVDFGNIFNIKSCCILLDTLVSGSPILQNGKLVGAVTHVLVDDPAKGYGIFAENMLENAKSVLDSTLREAS